MSPVGDVVRAARRQVRGVRGRLVTAYVLAATVAVSAGVVLFAVLLDRAVDANVDSDLRATGNALAADVVSGDVERVRRPRVDSSRPHRLLSSVVAIYGTDGTLVDAEPGVLPANPLTAADLHARSGLSTATYAQRSFRFFVQRVPVTGGTWLVVVGQNLNATDDANADARRVLYVIAPIAVLLSGVGAWLLSGAALRPVDRMRADAQRLSETSTPGTIGVPSTSDSLSKLAQTFNTLLHRLGASLQSQRDLVADAGHELRTPLAVLQTELETAVRPGRTRDDLVDSIRHAQQEAARLAALSEDLLLLAQADGPTRIVRPELVEPADVIAQSAAFHRSAFDAAGVELVLPPRGTGDPVVTELDPVALRRILDNLLTNALRHARGPARVEIALEESADDVVITVQDTGEGFPEDFLVHAFERFARADRSRSRSTSSTGSGLGLSIVATLVRAHHGTVVAQNRAEGGARIRMTFPRQPPE